MIYNDSMIKIIIPVENFMELYNGTLTKIFIIRIQDHSFLLLKMIITLLVNLHKQFCMVRVVVLMNVPFVRKINLEK